MSNPISELTIQKGIAAVDFSKLSPEMRRKILAEVGQAQMKSGNHAEAGKAYALLGDSRLRTMTAYFMNLGLAVVAAEYARHLDDRTILEDVAAACLNTRACDHAIRLYKRAGNEGMVRFIEKNF